MSTLYDITLQITYVYETPAGSSRTLLRMQPRTMTGQQLISGWVGTDPAPDFRRDGTDFFGNITAEITHDTPLTEIAFRFNGRVRRDRSAFSMDLSPALPGLAVEIAGLQSLAPDSPHHYLGASERVRPEGEIAAFASDVTDPSMSALGAVQAVSGALHRAMAFDPVATEVTTRPIQAFREKRGVCQDFSHIMIGALRSLGIPAGYVSGFLRTMPPEGQERLEGADAMHAWVRAWCGQETGWIEIDPTNDMMVGTDHIVVAFGRDYSDVAPVKGSLRAAGGHTTQHQVDVVSVP
jgi:transglutaminase-like putative cysteine protease